jgi:thiosulfate reductase cytochrome b subunit
MKNDANYFYPLWLRAWHWLNALLFISLIFTGLNMQYAKTNSPIIDFHAAIIIHNISGILLTINYLFFIIINFTSGNYMQYLPGLKKFFLNIIIQAKYYLYGIFIGSEHPFETSKQKKFNPLQQITYLNIMYVVLPLLIISGWAMLFPEFIFKQALGVSGLTLTAIVHTSIGFLLSIFMIGHIYLATTGTTVLSNFKSMITGFHSNGHNAQTNNNNLKNSEIKIQQVKK